MKLLELNRLGQAVWLDYIRRSFIVSGELQDMVNAGVRGVTSNPTIFEKAIAGSADYDADLQRLVGAGRSDEEICEELTLEDIRRAADVFLPVYERTGGGDGYVSLEVSPLLAHDTGGTVAEARRFFEALKRPNVMIKVPATPAGVQAIPVLIGEGINVNVTLIFSIARYEAVAGAYLDGLEKLATAGGDVGKVASVASFFVSRVDAAVDAEFESLGIGRPTAQIGVDNVKAAYARFREIFRGDRWESLAGKGARVQRLLWASTGAKDPLLPDTLYVDSLIGPDTVNTVPPATLRAFLDHGIVDPTLEAGAEEARSRLAGLPGVGIDLERIARELQDDGVAAFARSHRSLMKNIAEKRERLLSRWPPLSETLGARLGTILGELSAAGRDKLTLVVSPAIGGFGDWVEQLIAESTGKEGRGILPVVGEPPGPPGAYGNDRLFVYLRLEGDDSPDAAVRALEDAGHPVVRLRLRDLYDLGGQFFLWEMATAVAGHRLGIHPFDQPDVESAKVLARRMLADYQKKGELPGLVPALRTGGIKVYGDVAGETLGDALIAFLGRARPGDYVALQAYVQPGAGMDHALLTLRSFLRDRYRLATTVGYGPRFLHSTGQMHKRDAGRGLFIQWTSDDLRDAAIPDAPGSPESSVKFGILKMAQALGDRQALLDAGRRVIRVHLGPDPLAGFTFLTEMLT